MKPIAIYYFSGTGNTLYVANLMAAEFARQDVPCTLHPIEAYTLGKKELAISQDSIVGIAFPVHAMNAPRIVYDFLSLLPKGRFTYFLFKTAGDPLLNGGSNLPIKRILGQNGWRCIHECLYVMPANMATKSNPNKIKHLCLLAEKQATKVVADMLSGKVVREADTMLVPLFQAFSHGEDRGARKFSSRWKVNEDCTMCQKCVRECPTGNISVIEGKLVFSTKCIWCLRCSFFCPVQAISLPGVADRFRIPPFSLAEIMQNPEIKGDFFHQDKSVMHVLFRRYFRRQGIL